jgi:outer membrane protein TolC
VRDLRQETVKQYQEHLDVAQAMFHAGSRPRYYVTKAETDLSSEELDLIKAENDLQVAIVVLAHTMNIANPPPYDIVDNLDYEHYDAALDDIMGKAYSGRQDLKAYNLDAEAARRSLSFFRSDLYPSLNASGGYGASGTRNPLSQGWNAGVNLTASLFTGLLKISRVTEAEKSWRQAQTQIESLRLQIALDANRSFLNLKKAEKSIDTAKHGVEQAKENLDIANINYKVGSGTPLDVTDATVLYSNAKIDMIGALYDYKIAKASIEKTMGYQ